MTKILLWGNGAAYRECIDKVKQMAKLYDLQIVGVTSNNIPNDGVDEHGICKISIDNVTPALADYILIMAWAPRNIREIRKYNFEHGFKSNQVLSFITCLYYRWDWRKALDAGKELPLYNGTDLSIFAMNCSGGFLYHSLNMKFHSPFINMWISAPDYLKFLRNPRNYVEQSLQFVRYDYGLPVFLWGDLFVTLSSQSKYVKQAPKFAIEKWQERCARIRWDNLFVMAFTDDPSYLEEFDALPYEYKVCFTSFPSKLESAFYVDRSKWDNLTTGLISCRISQGEAVPPFTKLMKYLP